MYNKYAAENRRAQGAWLCETISIHPQYMYNIKFLLKLSDYFLYNRSNDLRCCQCGVQDKSGAYPVQLSQRQLLVLAWRFSLFGRCLP